MHPISIWKTESLIEKFLSSLSYVKNFRLKTKEHDSLYSFYEDYIDVQVEIDEQIYIAEKLATGLDLQQQIKNIAGKYTIYFEFVDRKI
jgi:GTP1/Obg family GTP-binding protein